MRLLSALQLAWSNTTDNWQRMFVRCAGIAFAVVLMFMETGFRNALFDSNVRIMQDQISADIVIRSASRYMFSARQLFPLDQVMLAKSCPGVRSVEPIYLENTISELRPAGQRSRRVRVLGLEPGHEMFAKFKLEDAAKNLKELGTAAADVDSKSIFGFPKNKAELAENRQYELAGKRVRLVAVFQNGIDFSNEGNLIMTPRNFANFFPMRADGDPLSQVDYGVVRCDTDVAPTVVIARLQEWLGPYVIVESRKSFIRSERRFWSSNTPIGLVFWVGTMIGFIVGMSICYQVLATDIADHLSEFSTLKAMGYGVKFFAAVVVIQALLLSLISFFPGVLISILSFQITNWGTGLFLYLDFPRTMLVLALTIIMCTLSGLIALLKLLVADPASLF